MCKDKEKGVGIKINSECAKAFHWEAHTYGLCYFKKQVCMFQMTFWISAAQKQVKERGEFVPKDSWLLVKSIYFGNPWITVHRVEIIGILIKSTERIYKPHCLGEGARCEAAVLQLMLFFFHTRKNDYTVINSFTFW